MSARFGVHLQGVMQLVLSIAFLIVYSAVYFIQNMDTIENTSDRIGFTIGFIIAELCGWTYTLLFPRYFQTWSSWSAIHRIVHLSLLQKGSTYGRHARPE